MNCCSLLGYGQDSKSGSYNLKQKPTVYSSSGRSICIYKWFSMRAEWRLLLMDRCCSTHSVLCWVQCAAERNTVCCSCTHPHCVFSCRYWSIDDTVRSLNHLPLNSVCVEGRVWGGSLTSLINELLIAVKQVMGGHHSQLWCFYTERAKLWAVHLRTRVTPLLLLRGTTV